MSLSNLTEEHKPRIMSDGLMFRAVCTCHNIDFQWRKHRTTSEQDWAEHALKTMKRNANRRSFAIIGNPLSQERN